MKKYVGISLAFGQPFKDKGQGKLAEPLDGGIRRFQSLMVKMQSLLSEAAAENPPWKIYCTAGFNRRSPVEDDSDTGDALSLGQQLRRYVRDVLKDHQVLEHLSVPPMGWGTEDEIRKGIQLAIDEGGFDPKDPEVTLLVSTNAAHHPRVRKYIKAFMPRAWTYVPVVAKHKFSLMDHAMEWAKRLRDWDVARKSE